MEYFASLRVSVIILLASCIYGCNTLKWPSYVPVGMIDMVDCIAGDTLFLKSGKFAFRGTINLPSHTVVKGNNTIIIINPNDDFPVFLCKDIEHVSILDIKVKSHKLESKSRSIKPSVLNYKYAIRITGSHNLRIDGCCFENLVGSPIKVLDSEHIEIVNCNFENIGLLTYRGEGYSYDGVFLGGAKGVNNVLIDSCKFSNIGRTYIPKDNRNNDGDGIQILSTGTIRDIEIRRCDFERCSARGIKIQGGKNISVSDCKFMDCAAGILMPMAVSLADVTLADNTMSGVRIPYGTDGDHMLATNIVVSNNKVDSCDHFFRTSGNSSLSNSIISSNIIGKTDRFVMSGRFIDTDIVDNKVYDYACAGDKSWNMAILLVEKSRNVRIERNTIAKKQGKKRMLVNRTNQKIVNRNNKERHE